MRKVKARVTEGVVFKIPPSTVEMQITVGVCDIKGRNVTLGIVSPPEVVQKLVGSSVTGLTYEYKPYIPKSQRNADNADGSTETG
jgi:hypothetical protein